MRSQAELQSDEIDVKAIFSFFKENRKTLLVGTVLSVAVSVALVFSLKPVYEVSGLVQVGKVAGADVESPSLALEKIKLQTFQVDVLKELGLSPERLEDISILSSNEEQLIEKSLEKITLLDKAGIALRNSNLIEVKMRGHSIESATKALNATVATLVKREDALAKPELDRMQKEKQAVASDLKNAEEKDLQSYRDKLIEFDNQLSSARTSKASFVEPLFSTQKKVSPSLTIFASMGFLLGLSASMIAAVIRNSCKKSS